MNLRYCVIEGETMDYKEAGKRFEEIVAGLAIKEYVATPAPGTNYTEKGPLRFDVSIGMPGSTENVRAHYQCGSALPLLAYKKNPNEFSRAQLVKRGAPMEATRADIDKAAAKQGPRVSLFEEQIRIAIRRLYCPSLTDVLSCLLIDHASTQNCTDWQEWAEEFGMLEEANAQKLRELERDFATIRARGHAMRALLRDKFDELLELAVQL